MAIFRDYKEAWIAGASAVGALVVGTILSRGSRKPDQFHVNATIEGLPHVMATAKTMQEAKHLSKQYKGSRIVPVWYEDGPESR